MFLPQRSRSTFATRARDGVEAHVERTELNAIPLLWHANASIIIVDTVGGRYANSSSALG